MARLAAGATLVTYGESMVLCAAGTGPARPGINFFPLTIDYREKTYAAGKIPGGFFKREGRPTTKEIITMRLTDRSVRPLFPEGFRDEVQAQCYVLSHDQINDTDILALNGASSALALSRIPFMGPVGCVRLGHVGGEIVVNPTLQQMEESAMDLVVAGTAEALTMVEGSANEVSEELVIEALGVGHDAVKVICEMQSELAALVNPTKIEVPPLPQDEELKAAIADKFAGEIRTRLQVKEKQARNEALSEIKSIAKEEFLPDPEDRDRKALFSRYWKELGKATLRDIVLNDGHRIDGRADDEIRKITCEVGLLPRAHGSALFTRGETQALVAATLGTSLDEQRIDGLTDDYMKHFMLHYNFPPFCVGETRMIRGPGRREIGHGNLAERACEAILPDHDDFPYTIRVVSDVLMSNGSSSMATVCGATLSMMDAGVTIRQPVAGIAMGLIKQDDNIHILSDILGDEDACGDMDFKVAGTQKGITALQMDIKLEGLKREVLVEALGQAREGRIHILREMLGALQKPRAELSSWAPKILQVPIENEKIGALIGPGGSVIRKLQEETKTKIAVDEDRSLAVISGGPGSDMETAEQMVRALTSVVEVGTRYTGRVVSIRDFGCFVEILPGLEGLVHVSELANGFVENVRDVVSEGDEIGVEVINVDDQGRVKLSKRIVDGPAKEGEEGEGGERKKPDGDRKPRDRGGRGGGGGGRRDRSRSRARS